MRRSRKPVAVLGCGPAGLLAAHAVTTLGYQVQIYSVKKPSPIGGAQFLHRAIPGLTDQRPQAFILHDVQGDAFTYQHKAYGRGAQPDFVSFAHVVHGLRQPAWSLRGAYERLWEQYEAAIEDVRITYSWVDEFAGDFSLVISAVPKVAICIYRDAKHVTEQGVPHSFHDQTIQIMNRCLPGDDSNNMIYYDGTNDRSWYRASNIFGVGSTEWGSHVQLPFPAHDIVKVRKPVATNCTCWVNNDHIMPVGRFGKWKKGELTHHAWEQVTTRLS